MSSKAVIFLVLTVDLNGEGHGGLAISGFGDGIVEMIAVEVVDQDFEGIGIVFLQRDGVLGGFLQVLV